MKFHEILRQRRLALGLTQEQLAQRLGVSAPAVNKWERNNSYPDITMLPPLARLLEVDLNTLLSFQEELTEEEIGAFANVLGERAQQEGCEAAFRLARDKLREYPNSDLLAYTAAQILDGALVLWKRGENDPEREQAWKGEILALYRRCADSGDRRVRERAERMLISQYMAQGELEQAEEQLARLPQEDRERPMLEAMLRRKQKRSEEAWPILERELFRQASDLQSTLMALMDLALEAGDKTCARQYSETAEQAGRVFQLTAYAVASAPLQLALADRGAGGAGTAPAQPGGALGPECVPSLPPLAHKGGCEGSPADHAPISAGGTGAGPGIRFPPGDPRIPGDAGAGSPGRNIDKINYFIRKIDLKNGLGRSMMGTR